MAKKKKIERVYTCKKCRGRLIKQNEKDKNGKKIYICDECGNEVRIKEKPIEYFEEED